MNKKEYTGIIAGILTISILGGNLYLSESQYNNAYVCEETGNLGVFYRLSSTMKTGYYVDDDGIAKGKLCSTLWVSLDKYLKSKGLNKKDVIKSNEACPVGKTCYNCIDGSNCDKYVGGS